MSSMNDCLADGVKGACDMLLWTIGDFSDADMLVRPTPAANHAMWQLGHLVNATTFFASVCDAANAPTLPAGFGEKYKKTHAGSDDAAQFDSKAPLTDQLKKACEVLVNFARRATAEELARPSPEGVQKFAVTIGHLLPTTIGHIHMHNGQMQVIRRKLGKPNLF